MQHGASVSNPSTKRRVPLAVHSFRRALDVSRFETPRHRRRRLEASRLNALAPISSLPPEILSHIFLFCVSSNPVVGTSGLGWLAVTHVTHRWREVALGCPELWANIIFRRKLLSISLSRSKMVPLVMRLNLDNNKHFKPCHIRENIARVGILDVRGSQNALETFFLDDVGNVPATRLRSLSVTNTILNDPLWLDAMVFHGGDEGRNHLSRQLRLERCALPWNSPWYSKLTELYLANLHTVQGPAIAMLFSVIIASPLLQHLTLINTKTHVGRLERFFPIPLRDLRTIHLSEPISVCSQILINLTFPSITTIAVSCLPAPTDKDVWLVQTLLCHRDFCEIYDFLRIEAPTGTSLRITTSSYWTDKTLLVEIYHPEPHLLVEPALQSLVKYSGPNFSHITSLHINIPFLGIASWQHLCACRNLTTLSLHNNDPLPMLALLLERAMRCIGISIRPEVGTEHLAPDGACMQIFAKLECIALEDVDCGASGSHPAIIDILRSLLWARRAGKCPIPRVRLDRCKNLFKQDLDHLKFLTDLLMWDGVGQNPEEKDDDGYLDIRSFSLNVYELSRFFL
ncbi:hypothetical protein B0H13DRAFT_2126038 [Mycena leptocephala]|nr:hypothetical protein B0H13DRAFT_2126038 [Mycena leptocephala]